MVAKHITDVTVLTQAAQTIGVRIDNLKAQNTAQTRWRFVLRPGPGKLWQRVSPSGRRVSAVCWHGHAAFFRELFKLDPDVEIQTGLHGTVDYTASNFEQTMNATGDANVGSMMAPCAYRDACDYDSHPVNRQ